MKSSCHLCGKCCWDWKGNNPLDRCEHLAEDLKTCLVHGRPEAPGACGGLTEDWPQPYHHVDLPPDCGYVEYWRKLGMI